jgi:hypothetical protein
MILYDAIMANEATAHGRLGLYFAENGAYELHEICAVISRVLFEHGKGAGPNPTSFTEEEIGPVVCPIEVQIRKPSSCERDQGILIGSNTKCTASKARALGWRPTKSTSAMLESAPGVTIKLAGLGGSA